MRTLRSSSIAGASIPPISLFRRRRVLPRKTFLATSVSAYAGRGHGADFSHRQPAAWQRPEPGPAHLLPQRHDAFFLQPASPGVLDRTFGLSDFRRADFPRLRVDGDGLCAATYFSFQPDQLQHPGTLSSFLLERSL